MGLETEIREPAQKMAGQAGPDMAAPTEELDIGRLFAVIWRAKLLLAVCTLLGVGAAYFHLSRVTPIYSAKAEVLWEAQEQNVVDIQPVTRSSLPNFFELRSQIKLVTSSGLLSKVVDELKLLQDPAFNPAARPAEPDEPGLLSVSGLFGWLGSAVFGATDASAASPEADPKTIPLEKQTEHAIRRLQRRIEANWVENSYVMSIRATSADPEMAAKLANTVAEYFILDQLEKKFEATRQATEWLSERVGELRAELEGAEQKVEAFASSSELVSQEALAASSRQVKEMRDRERELGAEAEALAADRAEAISAREQNDFPAAAEALQRPEMERIADRLGAGQQAAEAAPDLVARFDELMEQGIDAIAASLERIREQRAALQETIRKKEASLDRQADALVQLRQLEREAEASRLIYESFLSRLKETSVQQGIQQPDARVLSDAWVPGSPSSPNREAIIAVGGGVGFVVALLLVVMRERLNATFRTVEDLETRTGLAVLGSLPTAGIQRRSQLVSFLLRRPGSGFAEAVRNLRTSVLLANVDRPPQVIMVNSGLPGEGKTTTCISLAHISRSLGKRVVLLECDLRRRNFRRYFDIDSDGGLLAVLSGNKGYHEVVHIDEASGLHVVPGEQSSVNAADVFASRRFAEFIAELRQHYDFIVIDTPPVLAVPDARVIAQCVDSLLYVVRWNRTLRDTVTQGLRSYQQVNVKVSGLVLNGIDLREMARYGYRSYGYYKQAARYYQE